MKADLDGSIVDEQDAYTKKMQKSRLAQIQKALEKLQSAQALINADKDRANLKSLVSLVLRYFILLCRMLEESRQE